MYLTVLPKVLILSLDELTQHRTLKGEVIILERWEGKKDKSWAIVESISDAYPAERKASNNRLSATRGQKRVELRPMSYNDKKVNCNSMSQRYFL